jgi:hypothetical protein
MREIGEIVFLRYFNNYLWSSSGAYQITEGATALVIGCRVSRNDEPLYDILLDDGSIALACSDRWWFEHIGLRRNDHGRR